LFTTFVIYIRTNVCIAESGTLNKRLFCIKFIFLCLKYFAVDGEVISSIGKGLCVLLGISKHDTPKEIEYM